ncbi:MAG TPA: TetR/AcrR family transcriptional regulator [Candidatus Paenibacillus intestinavium]|nr:TetR/AcrR family transcriptional regulator [Candidatus Paenibacillus intestinavium]
MRITKKPEERKQEILDAAAILFTTKGYGKTTINDILQTVGIAKGTFYYHFQSKEEVMDAIVMQFINQGVTAAQHIMNDSTLNAHEKMFRILGAQSHETDHKGEMIEQLHQINNAEMHQKSLVETIIRLTPILTKIVEQGIREGIYNTPAPREVIEFLLVSSQFLLDRGIFPWNAEELVKKAHALAYMIEKTLGAQEGSFAYIPMLYERMIQQEEE